MYSVSNSPQIHSNLLICASFMKKINLHSTSQNISKAFISFCITEKVSLISVELFFSWRDFCSSRGTVWSSGGRIICSLCSLTNTKSQISQGTFLCSREMFFPGNPGFITVINCSPMHAGSQCFTLFTTIFTWDLGMCLIYEL